jgi:hypothetical protein
VRLTASGERDTLCDAEYADGAKAETDPEADADTDALLLAEGNTFSNGWDDGDAVSEIEKEREIVRSRVNEALPLMVQLCVRDCESDGRPLADSEGEFDVVSDCEGLGVTLRLGDIDGVALLLGLRLCVVVPGCDAVTEMLDDLVGCCVTDTLPLWEGLSVCVCEAEGEGVTERDGVADTDDVPEVDAVDCWLAVRLDVWESVCDKVCVRDATCDGEAVWEPDAVLLAVVVAEGVTRWDGVSVRNWVALGCCVSEGVAVPVDNCDPLGVTCCELLGLFVTLGLCVPVSVPLWVALRVVVALGLKLGVGEALNVRLRLCDAEGEEDIDAERDWLAELLGDSEAEGELVPLVLEEALPEDDELDVSLCEPLEDIESVTLGDVLVLSVAPCVWLADADVDGLWDADGLAVWDALELPDSVGDRDCDSDGVTDWLEETVSLLDCDWLGDDDPLGVSVCELDWDTELESDCDDEGDSLGDVLPLCVIDCDGVTTWLLVEVRVAVRDALGDADSEALCDWLGVGDTLGVPDGLDETLWLPEEDWLPVRVGLDEGSCELVALLVRDWLGVHESDEPSDFVWLAVPSCETDGVRDDDGLRLSVCVAV